MLACLPRLLAIFSVVLLLASPAPGRAASPRDELLRFVPDDHGFCLIVQDLRARAADLLDSPFAPFARASTLGKSIAGAAELAQIEAAERHFHKHLGVGWKEIRDDLLGDAFVFAYRPGPAGKPEQEQGLFLLRARTARPLANFIDRLNDHQKKTGELVSLDSREYRGIKYFRRIERKETHYYLVRGPILLFTGQQAILHAALDRDLTLAADAEPVLTRRLRDLEMDRATAVLTLNPRAFEDAVNARGAGDISARTFSGYWKALDSAAVGLHLDRDVRLSMTIKARTVALPAAARRFLASAARTSDLWKRFPENALLTLAGRLDLPALYETLADFTPKASRLAFETDLERTLGAILGKDIFKDILPALGPDWGLCLTAAEDAKVWAPQLLFALRVARGDESDPTDQTVLSAVHSWAQFAVLAHNKQNPTQTISLRSTILDRVRIRYLHGAVFPAGVQPAFALRDGYLVLASSPQAIRSFTVRPGLPTTGPSPLLRFSARDWRDYLRDRREHLAAALAARQRISKEKAAEKLDALRASLELVDRIDLLQKTTTGQFTLSLVVQPARPLKK